MSVPPPAPSTADNLLTHACAPPTCIPPVFSMFSGDADSTACPHPADFPSLHNPGNHCYMNALVYSLCALEQHLGRRLLPPTFHVVPGRSLSAYRALGFCLLGWGQPHSQQDAAEFADFVLPKLVPDNHCASWQARRLEEGTLRLLDRATLNQCLSLSQLDVRHPDIQQLLFRWHHQSALHALSSRAPWLLVQLPRTSAQGNRVEKRCDHLRLDMCYRIPIFVGAATLDTIWCRYVPLAFIIHHGPSFSAGHYTTLMPEGEGLFSVLDDDRDKRRATPAELAHASCNAYLMLLVPHSHPDPQHLESQALIVSSGHVERRHFHPDSTERCGARVNKVNRKKA